MSMANSATGEGEVHKNSRYVEPKDAYDIWMMVGTLEKARLEFKRRGIVNLETKKPPNINTICQSAWRYALEDDLENIRLDFKKLGYHQAKTLETWLDFLIPKARTLLSPSSRGRFLSWIRTNNLEDVAIRRGYILENER